MGIRKQKSDETDEEYTVFLENHKTRETERLRRRLDDPAAREAVRETKRRWRERNPVQERAIQRETRRRNKAADPERWNAVLRRQYAAKVARRLGIEVLVPDGSTCAICGHPGSDDNKLVRDHDHGKPVKMSARDVLCHKCNRRLGVIEKHGVTWLGAALRYLMYWSAPSVAGIIEAISSVIPR
jgi:hypothetical protein